MVERVKHLLGFFIFLIGFAYAFQVSVNSFNGEFFVNIQELIPILNRDIASANKLERPPSTLLLSTEPRRILMDAKLNLMPQASKEDKGPMIEIILGHFSMSTRNNPSVFVCQLYDEVILTYEALSTTTTADKKTSLTPPLMTIKAPCTIDPKDLLHLKAIQLTPQKITQEPPGDGGMQTSQDGSYTLYFENMEDQWPSAWKFKSVQLKTNKSNAALPTQALARTDLPTEEQGKLDFNWQH